MDHIIINKNTAPTKEALRVLIRNELRRYDDEVRSRGRLNVKPRALVIDGPSLITVMTDSNTELTSGKNKTTWMQEPRLNELFSKELLILLSLKCQAVIGCRVSPDQKREMVHLVKANVPGMIRCTLEYLH